MIEDKSKAYWTLVEVIRLKLSNIERIETMLSTVDTGMDHTFSKDENDSMAELRRAAVEPVLKSSLERQRKELEAACEALHGMIEADLV